jgi:hypothetical protein
VENILEVSGGNAQEVAAAQGFILLCELTLITREMLIITYNLASITTNEVIRKLGEHEVSLDRWEDLFLEWKRNNKSSNSSHIPGESSLTLEFLTTKMLLRRIALHVRICSLSQSSALFINLQEIFNSRRAAAARESPIQSDELQEICSRYCGVHG